MPPPYLSVKKKCRWTVGGRIWTSFQQEHYQSNLINHYKNASIQGRQIQCNPFSPQSQTSTTPIHPLGLTLSTPSLVTLLYLESHYMEHNDKIGMYEGYER